MKRLFLPLALGVITLTGCIDPMIVGFKTIKQEDDAKLVLRRQPLKVHPDQVNESNAHAMAAALAAEIEFDSSGEMKSPAR